MAPNSPSSDHPATVQEVRIRPWRDEDYPLLVRLLGDEEMTRYVGGPESPEQLKRRHERYLGDQVDGAVFAITLGEAATPVGWVGYWETAWEGRTVWETGWHVLPEYQGRGIASRATGLALQTAAAEGRHEEVHAFPSVDNAASNAVCRKLAFELIGPVEIEYPKGHPMVSNDWRLVLSAADRCPECGTPLQLGEQCISKFHAMLAMEADVPGAPGGLPHFYAVACYGLQHPDAMGFTVSTVEGLRRSVELALSGEADVAALRRRASGMSSSAGRVTRRGSEPVPCWGIEKWPMTVADVRTRGAADYAESVERWASSIIGATEGHRPER